MLIVRCKVSTTVVSSSSGSLRQLIPGMLCLFVVSIRPSIIVVTRLIAGWCIVKSWFLSLLWSVLNLI